MKKVLAIALGLLLIPFSAFCMESMTVDEMAEITGQSGVAISLDDVKVFFYTENEETWYQSDSTYTAASGDFYDYDASLGLIRSDFGQMLYVNAVLATNTFQGAAGNFTSVGSAGGIEHNMARPLMISANVAGNNYTGTAAYMALASNYGFSFGNKSFGALDNAFDSRALTIRAVNRAEVFSLASFYRLEALRQLGALAPGYAGVYDATYTATDVHTAAVVIGLPTAEIHYKRARGETLEILLSTAADPLTRVGFWDILPTVADTWSYGKIHYGSWSGPNAPSTDALSERTILILDGFIEITPIEAYANPGI